MDDFIAVALVAVICWYCFRHGKSTGSRKGFSAGRRSQRRRRY